MTAALVIIIFAYQGVAVTSVPMVDLETCAKAAVQFKKDADSSAFRVFCVRSA